MNATARWADWRWTLRVDDSDFQMPAVEAGSWFGSAPVGGDFPGLRAVRDEGWRIEIGREFDGLNLYAGIARDLVDQPANETITGQISASVFGESSTTALTAYHRYRDDTFLSRVGNVDAREPAPFGGAVSTGLRGLYARSVAADWSAAVSGHYETIRGELEAYDPALAKRRGIEGAITDRPDSRPRPPRPMRRSFPARRCG